MTPRRSGRRDVPRDWDGQERRANVDSLSERMAGLTTLAMERWDSHHEKHKDLAQSLMEYKAAANEWRQTLADVRLTFLGRAEFVAEHKALVSTTEAALDRLEARMTTLERAMQTITDRQQTERLTTRTIFGDLRNVIVLGFTILGGLISLAIYLKA